MNESEIKFVSYFSFSTILHSILESIITKKKKRNEKKKTNETKCIYIDAIWKITCIFDEKCDMTRYEWDCPKWTPDIVNFCLFARKKNVLLLCVFLCCWIICSNSTKKREKYFLKQKEARARGRNDVNFFLNSKNAVSLFKRTILVDWMHFFEFREKY